MNHSDSKDFSGERFRVTYHLRGSNVQARSVAHELCIEQTVEFPEDLIHQPWIRDHVFGRIESLQPVADEPEPTWAAVLSYAVETAGQELTQLLNVIYGNFSLKPGVRVQHLDLSPQIVKPYVGPRFGVAGLRQLLRVPQRPVLATAIKPMGLGGIDLAAMAGQLALGGMDIIKDDHGLADQSFGHYAERVARCAEAVQQACAKTGEVCLYAPNVAARFDQVLQRAHFAKQCGAGALLVAPGLVGWDTMRALAEDDTLGLPIFAHPALTGAFVAERSHGLAHGVVFGQLARLAGADVSIFPHVGGRFAFSARDCSEIAEHCAARFHHLAPILPAPAGGMSVNRSAEMRAFYGNDVVLLVGGDLHRNGGDLVANGRHFRALVE